MKQRTLERDLLSPKYRQRVEVAHKGKGSYDRNDEILELNQIVLEEEIEKEVETNS